MMGLENKISKLRQQFFHPLHFPLSTLNTPLQLLHQMRHVGISIAMLRVTVRGGIVLGRGAGTRFAGIGPFCGGRAGFPVVL